MRRLRKGGGGATASSGKYQALLFKTHCNTVQIWSWCPEYSSSVVNRYPAIYVICYYNNSDATFRLLISGKINPNSGPVSASTAGKINFLVMNARSLKSYYKHSTINWQSVCNLHRFQGLVYAENSDVICVNET